MGTTVGFLAPRRAGAGEVGSERAAGAVHGPVRAGSRGPRGCGTGRQRPWNSLGAGLGSRGSPPVPGDLGETAKTGGPQGATIGSGPRAVGLSGSGAALGLGRGSQRGALPRGVEGAGLGSVWGEILVISAVLVKFAPGQ